MVKNIFIPIIFIITLFIGCSDDDGDNNTTKIFTEKFEMSEWQRTDNSSSPGIYLNYMRFEIDYPAYKKHWHTTNADIPDLDCFFINSDTYFPNAEMIIIENTEDYLKYDLEYIAGYTGQNAKIGYTFSYKNGIMTEQVIHYSYGNEYNYTWESSEVDLNSLKLCE